MTDRFETIPVEELATIILAQLKTGNKVFEIPREMFFEPHKTDPFRLRRFGQTLETPVGVAAGPHTQLAQNIVAAWLTGARYIELKTIQTLDELKISKPCIDMQDEGYNCEWSQELKIRESFNQYLDAWILIHILKHELGHDESEPGVIFNMSAGYDYQGIMKENVQWFFDKMEDAGNELYEKVERLKKIYPAIAEIKISSKISDNITLSTMHGCPPDEIEKIGRYLIGERKYHTTVKLNPTLLGKEHLQAILKNSGFDTVVPDEAFEHDLKYPDALSIIKNLQKEAAKTGRFFGLKLTNTLESVNNKNVFPAKEKMMYMSGRALHPISVNLASKLQNDFDGKLDISFSGGADAFNISPLLASGLAPVTVCSDILKPGGYGRIFQYMAEIANAFKKVKAGNMEEFIRATGNPKESSLSGQVLYNLRKYAGDTLEDNRYKKTTLHTPSIKTGRPLGMFDCIHAPCIDTCPTNQHIPDYMYHTAKGDFQKAFQVIMKTNPFPNTTGMVCDHLCTTKCTRINYEEPLHIREIKRFVAEYAVKNSLDVEINKTEPFRGKAAVIGAGPSGLSCARYLQEAGFETVIYEAKQRPGGMVSGAIPSFRLTDEAWHKDIERIEKLGVKIHFNTEVTKPLFEELRQTNRFVYIATGAKKSRKLTIDGSELPCVLDPIDFLFRVKESEKPETGKRIAVIGGGNTAMDAARTVFRLTGVDGKVTVLYRRRVKEMPADQGEITAVLEEGIEIMELVAPVKIEKKQNSGCKLTCIRMKPGSRDESGRARPVPIEGSEFSMEFDTIIPAIGQDLDIGFTDQRLLQTNPGSYQTKLKNVYIGGDALRGASTAINAIGDGRKAAAEMVARAGKELAFDDLPERENMTLTEHRIKRSIKVDAIPVKELPLEKRKSFLQVSETFTEEEAKKEASRCLLCDEVCNVCTTVCPNIAFHSFETEPVTLAAPFIVARNGKVEINVSEPLRIEQKHQILHIADWCNQCGNCATFCPTAGEPYREKPHLYLNRLSFVENRDGYFYDSEKDALTGFDEAGEVLLKKNASAWEYQTKRFDAVLKNETMDILTIILKTEENFEISLKKAAEMRVIFTGVLSFLGKNPKNMNK